jgi:hypothetical protein
MRIRQQGGLILIALSIVMATVAVGVAQRAGGYKEVAKDSPEVEEAAEFAVNEQGRKQELTYKLVAIEKAESQTVAGINYRLCLKVSKDEEATEFVRAVVYRNLQKQYSLTSWAQEDCSEG